MLKLTYFNHNNNIYKYIKKVNRRAEKRNESTRRTSQLLCRTTNKDRKLRFEQCTNSRSD